MPKVKRSEQYSWGEIFDSFKRGVIGSEDDFDDDFEEVEEAESARPTDQTGKKTKESANPGQESEPAAKPAQKPDKDSGSVFCSTLQTDLNAFVQTGTASNALLQLLKEGFDKNPDLLEEIAKYIAARRRGEERIHPGFLVSYNGESSMLLTKEKTLDYILSRPGSTVRETIFVSLVKDGKTISTREATDEEKKLYSGKSSKVGSSAKAQ